MLKLLFFTTIKVLEDIQESDTDSALERVINQLKNPKRLLATILVANNFINIAIVLVFSALGDTLFKGIENPYLILFIEIGLITSLILLFGEILPKIYANRNALAFSKRMALLISFLDRYLLFWITYPMSQTTSFLENRLGDKKNHLSVDQLSQALELTGANETTFDEQRILEGIVNFGNTDNGSNVPKDGYVCSFYMPTLEEILYHFRTGLFKNFVYHEKRDIIKGILYTKDLLPNLEEPNLNGRNSLSLQSISQKIKN